MANKVIENVAGKKILVVGLARSGQSAVKVLHEQGARVWINDMKTEEALLDVLKTLKGKYEGAMLGTAPVIHDDLDMLVMSPGVPVDKPFVTQARQRGVEVIGELELGYRLSEAQFVGITGTNGKTTTTALTGEMFSADNKAYFVVGNIGTPVIECVQDSTDQTTMVTEVSSFQLETISQFKTKVSAILNLTPDHLNRHKTMENYIDAKCRIFENHTKEDVLVLNYDDAPTRVLAERSAGRVIYFSRKEILEEGVFIKDNQVVVVSDKGQKPQHVLAVDDIFIPGNHNIENALAASAVAFYSGVQIPAIAKALKAFKGVAHRIEWVGQIEDVVFFNDSKGTNPDASIVAVRAMDRPTILIAGGMDKGSAFDTFITSFGEKIKKMIVFGETSDILEETAKRNHYDGVVKVNNLEEAVAKAYALATSGDAILLSPACASWDMYPSFEHRGDHFKACFEALRGH
jgi:UDP-N-acetylmuramoylalanine--D-glutamate ligase